MPDYGNASPALVALLRAAGMDPSQIEEYLATNFTSPNTQRTGSGAGQTTDPSAPPYMSFDPALEAQQRALERGLEDLLKDTGLERRYARQDTAQSLEDLRQDKHRGLKDVRQQRGRGLTDIATDKQRGLRNIETRRSDVQTDAARGREDFGSRLANLIHTFQVKGNQQRQAANASGTLDASTTAAGEAARSANFARSREPIDTGLARLGADEQTALERLATTQSDLLSDTALTRQRLLGDTHTAAHRLRQDVAHDEDLAAQQLARQERDIRLRRQRARREERIGQADLTEQEIFQARQNHPGAFDTSGNRRHRRDQ